MFAWTGGLLLGAAGRGGVSGRPIFGSRRFPFQPDHDPSGGRPPPEGLVRLRFAAELEQEFRETHLQQNFPHLRANITLGVVVCVAFSAVQTLVLGSDLNRIPSMIQMLLTIPALLLALAVSFSPRRLRLYPPLALLAALIVGASSVAAQIIASLGGVATIFPSLLLSAIFVYFLLGLGFQQALGANVVVLFLYLGAGAALRLPGREFGYDALVLVAVNLFAASAVYRHEKISRMRFLEAGSLREMVARDGLTGIHNRRMFDQYIVRTWQQALRETRPLAVLLVDIDCFKDFNDRYGHQAGDECLRAVAVSLHQCARRPLDFVARYGGEEFAVVVYDASGDYIAEISTRIQRSIAELNIAHEASRVASRLTVSIGAALILPSSSRTHEGLVQLADEALYAAKEQGRNRVIVMQSEYQSLTTGRFEKRRVHRTA